MFAQEVVDDPTGNKMLLVMDYMEGGPVMTRDALERGRCIPEPLALQYFRDMCKVCLCLAQAQLVQAQLFAVHMRYHVRNFRLYKTRMVLCTVAKLCCLGGHAAMCSEWQ